MARESNPVKRRLIKLLTCDKTVIPSGPVRVASDFEKFSSSPDGHWLLVVVCDEFNVSVFVLDHDDYISALV